jgi:hypothetical protein
VNCEVVSTMIADYILIHKQTDQLIFAFLLSYNDFSKRFINCSVISNRSANRIAHRDPPTIIGEDDA